MLATLSKNTTYVPSSPYKSAPVHQDDDARRWSANLDHFIKGNDDIIGCMSYRIYKRDHPSDVKHIASYVTEHHNIDIFIPLEARCARR